MTMRNKLLRLIGALFSVGIAAFGYWNWLNIMPTVQIPISPIPSPNGWNGVCAATTILRDGEAVANAVADRPDENGHVYTLAEREALVAHNASALRAMRFALPLPYWNSPFRPSTLEMPESRQLRAMIRLLRLEAKVRLEHGDTGGSAGSCLDAIEIGVKVPHGGSLIPEIFGSGYEQSGDASLWQVIDRLDAGGAASATHRLEAITDQRFPYARTLQEDKWRGQGGLINDFTNRSTFQCYHKYVKGWGAFVNFVAPIQQAASPGDVFTLVPTSEELRAYGFLLLHSKRKIFSDYSNVMDAYIAQSYLPWSVNLPAIEVPAGNVKPFESPDLREVRFENVEIRTRTGLALCALALRAFLLRHHAYPESLDDLVKDKLLRRVPDDVFAPVNKQPLSYRRISTGEYRLYSVGPDGVDDGGRAIPLKLNNRPGNNFLDASDKGDWVVGIDIGPVRSDLTR